MAPSIASTWRLALLALSHLSAVTAQDSILTTVEWRTGNAKVDALVEQLTPREKIGLVGGTSDPGYQQQAGYVAPVSRLGIPAIRLTDGEAGINVVDNATAIPLQLNVAATWSKEAAYNAGMVTGKEANILGQTVALAPRVNILRDPVDGNFWQSYSEDPFLNAQLGVQGVHGIQDQGTMANPKQIGPSSTGASNGDINSVVDMQTLQEVYWSAPGALLEVGAATLMCSYAQVNGVPACQYKPLFDTVRNMYNSSAIVVSDWGATHSTADSITAGLDLEMPSGTWYGDPLYNSIYTAKNLSATYLDRAVARILNQYDRFGLLDGNTTTVASPISSEVELDHAALSYEIAVKSGVLLKNDNHTLPLLRTDSLAVIGPNGVQYSHGTNFAERAYGFPDRQISPLEALRNRTGREDIPSAVGIDQEGTLIPASALQSLDGTQGLTRNDSSKATSIDSTVDFSRDRALPANRTYEWRGFLNAPESGIYTISLQRAIPSAAGKHNPDYGNIFAIGSLSVNRSAIAAGYRLFGDGGVRPWSNSITTRDGWDNIKATVHLEAGQHNISASIIGLLQQPVSVRLCWVTPSQRETNIQTAVSLAATVKTPLLFAFANSPAQLAMTLDDSQDELVSRVVAANPDTVLILNNAEPITMPWLSSVPAVLEMFYPGQEGSLATIDLLLGNRHPAGRLPVTYPSSLNTSLTRNPLFPERVATPDGNATFSEGVNVGYRWYTHTKTHVLFPFGYGLSYTTFKYSDLSIRTHSKNDALVIVSFCITNTGSKASNAVPQLYLGPPVSNTYGSSIQFASIALAGFANVDLAPGETKNVKISVSRRSLSFYNVVTEAWELVRGERKVWVGKDVQDLVLEGSVVI
ncbi:glycoside hydrolase superfamily [Lophiotrema nucula]|uniref:beta-glucosidase n=1 Tax=Lophiotrema nucula TaxID=690887 RepID=A0A6A5ZL08_9PLEO|nr:glycoside hydrolase superfamily [Lophiotrema nucula]